MRPIRSIAFGFLIVSVLAGCSDLGRRLVLAPNGELSASAIDFGSVLVAQSVTRTLTIRNTGNANLTGAAAVACANFGIVSGGGVFTIAPGGSREVVLRFQPAAQGAFGCTLDLGPDLPAVSLAGSGAFQAPGAAWSVSATSVDFGRIGPGETTYRAFTIRSVGTAPLLVDVVSQCLEFLPIQGGGQSTLAPGDSLVVRLLFNPLTPGTFDCAVATGAGGPNVSLTGFAWSVSFTRDLRPILTANSCTTCHWFLDPVYRLTYVVNSPSAYSWGDGSRASIVRPFQPDSSVLFHKISGTDLFGQRMPQGLPPLTPEQLEKIRTWILEGAIDN